jgi:hypothetical protein
MRTRSLICYATIFVCLAAVALVARRPACSAAEPNERVRAKMKRARKAAAQRQRRIIYNDDGCNVEMYDTPEKFLSLRLRQVVNTQVDSVFHCTGVTGLFLTHFPKVGELVGEFVSPDSMAHAIVERDSMRALAAQGKDPLAIATDYLHENRVEVFWSLRMNDIHDSMPGCEWLMPRFKREHPEYLLGKPDQIRLPMSDPRYWWSAFNYERPEVREYVYRMIEDVCARYDVDGVELDWFRSPLLFPETLDLRDATARHTQ